MILDRDRLFAALRAYVPCQDTGQPYDKKLEVLDAAIDAAVDPSIVHFTVSGGVDSSLMLIKAAARAEQPLTAHTMVNALEHPDATHSRLLINLLQVTQLVYLVHSEPDSPDNYYLLMERLHSVGVTQVVCCDVIDELTGGYYAHLKEPSQDTLAYFVSRLIPDHLEILDKASSAFGIEVYLPYGTSAVLQATAAFTLEELIDSAAARRKKPIYDLAARVGVPIAILTRRKLGLVAALDSKRKS